MDLRAWKSSTILATVALLAVACSNPADNVDQAVVGDAQGAATADAGIDQAAPPAETAAAPTIRQFVFADSSEITWVGSSIARSHEGGFNGVTGSINLVDGKPEASQINLEIDITSMYSDNGMLTNHLSGADFFEMETYPTATFTSTAIVPEGEAYRVTGDLNLHGITKSISFPATIEITDDMIHATSEFAIMRFDWGIDYNRPGDRAIRDEVVVRFDVMAHPAG